MRKTRIDRNRETDRGQRLVNEAFRELKNSGEGGKINPMDSIDIEKIAPSHNLIRYPVTQEQIDDVLKNELKNFEFPVKPIYNPRIKDNGRTIGEIYKWGQLKQIKSIEIGKQDNQSRHFLIDTLLHEYYEAEIMEKQYTDDFYKKLSNLKDNERHNWIHKQIELFFKEMEASL
jgi:hypothetical protein